ncbi:hypothetical protein WJX77_001671 [Trebouxia sp. C0004]
MAGHNRAPSEGIFGTLASWGGSALEYASTSINSLLGFEDLQIVNPDSTEAEQATEDAADQRQQEFTNYRDYIGMDITSLVALPVWIMMPFSMLQNISEIMEYTDRLEKAAKTEDPYERLAWVIGFTMGPFPGNERTWKPFNPILGETFELAMDNGLRFIAEQVSHHPPVGAAHAENKEWEYDMVSAPTTKFLGNSIDIYPIGRTRIRLKSTGEVYSLVPPNCKAHNLIVGRTWVDSAGDYTLLNATTGAKGSMYFTPCGWFGSGHHEISGHVTDEEGKKRIALVGKWNSYLDMQKCDEEGTPLPGAQLVRLWTCSAKPDEADKYGFSNFARMLMSGKGLNPLPSDSRRRPDRTALELGDHGKAGQYKYQLEEAQRAEKREREKRGDTWSPRFFRRTPEKDTFSNEFSDEQCPLWEFNGEYMKLDPRPAMPEGDCAGKDFFPWKYAELHKNQRQK